MGESGHTREECVTCANHPNVAAVAYCRTCGKPLCASCTRDVKGVIYCESCLAERLAGAQPPPPAPPPAGFVYPGVLPSTPATGPNPAVAGILAGFFPFGVGAVYTGQYAKGLAHLLIFVGLIFGMDQASPLDTFCAFAFAFFYVWQIIDAVRTSKAIELGQPVPDPLGLGHAFGGGEKADTSKIPVFALVLIGLGVLFLLETAGIFEFSVGNLWPVFLILLGVWIFARHSGWVPSNRAHRHPGRVPGLIGPVVLIIVGVLSLLEHLGGPGWHRTWPLLLLAIGLAKLLERQIPPPPPPPLGGGTGLNSAASPEGQPPVSEVKNG
jgi:TM2 domain-containing membrane protein YozV